MASLMPYYLRDIRASTMLQAMLSEQWHLEQDLQGMKQLVFLAVQV